MEPKLKFIPHEIDNITIDCKQCGRNFKPDWLENRGGPMLAKIPANGGGYWIREQAFVNCTSCNQQNLIKIPYIKQKTQVLLYGDEAYRKIENSNANIFSYSVVGISKPFLKDIERLLFEIKKDLQPELPPNSWKIHMKELWSGHQRNKRKGFENWDLKIVWELINKVSNIFYQMGNKLFKANITLAGDPKNGNSNFVFSNYIRDESYVLLISSVIHEMTKLGAQPIIYFDAEKNAKADIIIHKWAKDIFIDTQNTLFFSFMSKGIEIPEPRFVQPGSTPLSELADFISFIIARYHFRNFSNKQPEIDPKLLGNVMYMTFSENGRKLLYQTQTGYPWKMNY